MLSNLWKKSLKYDFNEIHPSIRSVALCCLFYRSFCSHYKIWNYSANYKWTYWRFYCPFFTRGIRHLLSNTIPLITLLIVLNTIYPTKTLAVFLFVTLAGGMLVWIFGRDANHIGASGLIYGLVAFLIVNGILEKKYIPILVSIGIGVVYGGLIWGIFPSVRSYISWEGHLFGAISGVLIAFLLKKFEL